MVEAVTDTRGDLHAPVDSVADILAEMEAKTLGDTRCNAFALVETLRETLTEVEKVGDTRGDAHALVNTLADTVAEKEAGGVSWGNAHAKVDTLADLVAEVYAVTPGDTRGDAHSLVELCLTPLQRWRPRD